MSGGPHGAVRRLARIVNSRGNVSCSPLLRQHAEQHAIPAYRHVPTGRRNMEEYYSIGQPLTDGDVRPERDLLQRIVLH